MENGEEQLKASQNQEKFMKEFIQLYKENAVLWDKSHPKYKSRHDRDVANQILLTKCCEYVPDASMDMVKTRIDSMRGAFRREHRKVEESKKDAVSSDEIYTPSLWYYNLLLFLVGEQIKEDPDSRKNNTVSGNHCLYAWPKQHTILLIDLLKKYPILYSANSAKSTKSKRMKAYKSITDEIISQTGVNFELHDIRNKIGTLKTQFRREYKNREVHRGMKRSTLWCYDLLLFLKDMHSPVKHVAASLNEEGDSSDDMDIKETVFTIQIEEDMEKKADLMEQDDIFDTIGKNVAMKLRDMSDEQRLYAEALLNDLMYNGLMENLNPFTKLSFFDEN